MLLDLPGSGHQEQQTILVYCEGLCEQFAFLKGACEHLKMLAFKFLLLLCILSLPQGMSGRYYLKFLMADLRGHAYCWRLKPSCGHKLGGAGECSNCCSRG